MIYYVSWYPTLIVIYKRAAWTNSHVPVIFIVSEAPKIIWEVKDEVFFAFHAAIHMCDLIKKNEWKIIFEWPAYGFLVIHRTPNVLAQGLRALNWDQGTNANRNLTGQQRELVSLGIRTIFNLQSVVQKCH